MVTLTVHRISDQKRYANVAEKLVTMLLVFCKVKVIKCKWVHKRARKCDHGLVTGKRINS